MILEMQQDSEKRLQWYHLIQWWSYEFFLGAKLNIKRKLREKKKTLRLKNVLFHKLILTQQNCVLNQFINCCID